MLDKAAHGDGLSHHLIGHERRRRNYGHLLPILFDGQIRAAVFVVPADGQHMQFVQLDACVLRQIRMSIGSFLPIFVRQQGLRHQLGERRLGIVRRVTFAEQLNVAGVFRLHHAVGDVGNLPLVTRCVVLHRTDDAHFVAGGENRQTLAAEVEAVVDGDAEDDAALRVKAFDIHRIVVRQCDDAVESDLLVLVRFRMAAQFAQGQLDGVAVVEIGVGLTGVEVQLELPRLIQRA